MEMWWIIAGVLVVVALALRFLRTKAPVGLPSPIGPSPPTDIIVGSVNDFKDGGVTEVKIEGESVLVVREGSSFTCVGSKCTHQKYNLKSGVYHNGRLRCPLHGACYSTVTGDIEDYPGCNPLPSFPVRVEKGKVIVRVDKSQLKNYEPRPMKKRDPKNEKLYVIIGGGAAGGIVSETLRAEGFTGRILVINREKHLPYDRPKLSKVMNTDISKALLRPASFYQTYDIETKLGVTVEALHPKDKTIVLNTGEVIKYDQAVIATGADCQRFNERPLIPGHDAKNIHILRTLEDANNIHNSCEKKNVLIVGSSFIGMEVASCIVSRANSVTVLGMEKVPFERVLGFDIGTIMKKFHEHKGVKIIMDAIVKEFVQANGECYKVILRDGSELNCDVIVLGAGVIPATSYIKDDGLVKIFADKSVIVDKYLYTGAEGLWAVGDLARHPLSLLDGRLVRIEHWGMAQTQAAAAAKNMVHGPTHTVDQKIPYFWTVQYGKNIRYCGHALEFQEIIFDKLNDDVTNKDFGFVAYYVMNDKVVAACSLNRDPTVAVVSEIMNAGILLSGSELKSVKDKDQLLNSKLNK